MRTTFIHPIKGAFSSLRRFLANDSTLKMMKNAFYLKGNQTIKFSQLIEYNMRNIFLEKSYRKCLGEAFSKKSKLGISLDQ